MSDLKRTCEQRVETYSVCFSLLLKGRNFSRHICILYLKFVKWKLALECAYEKRNPKTCNKLNKSQIALITPTSMFHFIASKLLKVSI